MKTNDDLKLMHKACIIVNEDALRSEDKYYSKGLATGHTTNQPWRLSLGIEDVKFNGPVTIVFWKDGSKTVVKCGKDDTFDKEKGLAMAILKMISGNDNTYHKIFKKWCVEEADD